MNSIEWIDIKLNPPPKGIKILVCDENCNLHFFNTGDADTVMGKIYWIENFKFNNGDHATYWLPLPTPPKENL